MRGLGTMRSFRAILILSAWALAAPSLAQEADRTASPAKDAATIEACLKGKETSAKRRTCIEAWLDLVGIRRMAPPRWV